MELKVGDVVRLKSGGPTMTVTHLNLGKIVGCTCFLKTDDGGYQPFEGWFESASLLRAEETEDDRT